jgi:hypothetical protein
MDFTEYKAQQRAYRKSRGLLYQIACVSKVLLTSPEMILPFCAISFAVFVNVHDYHVDKWVKAYKARYPVISETTPKSEALVDQMYINCLDEKLHSIRDINKTEEKLNSFFKVCQDQITDENALKSVPAEDVQKAFQNN